MRKYPALVDIGTEWNLKEEWEQITEWVNSVDIGTEWNLKLDGKPL